jgi:fermentation-respiration switch protein FrsA (DUF1100 family)
MRRTHWVIERPVGRLVSRVALRTRISPAGWDPVPAPPHELAPDRPAPLLVVHGDADHYFPVEHGEQLFAAAASRRSCGSRPDSGTPRTPRRTNCFDGSAAGSPPRRPR